MEPGTYYVWVGGSCDYGHPERWGGGCYIVEQENNETTSYATAEIHTTEFRMMFIVMTHALNAFPSNSTITFLTNVSYIKQAVESYPTKVIDNQDLIAEYRKSQERHANVEIKIVNYHKYPQMALTHQRAHEVMCELRRK